MHHEKHETDTWDDVEATLNPVSQKEVIKDSKEADESLIRNWTLMSSIAVYCVFSLHDMAYTEVGF